MVAGVIAAVIIIKKMWKKPTPNIEVAAAASNPRNEGPSLLARARVVNLLRARNQPLNLLRARGRKKRVIEGEVVYLEQFKSLYLSN